MQSKRGSYITRYNIVCPYIGTCNVWAALSFLTCWFVGLSMQWPCFHFCFSVDRQDYNNLLLKYALWARAVGAHLVGRCVLYSYRFLYPLIQCYTTGNEWNMRQRAWPKPNDVKSLQGWASRTHRASGCWGGSIEVSEGAIWKVAETLRIEEEPPIYDEIQPFETFADSESDTDFKALEALHIIVLDIDDQLLCSDAQMEVGERCTINYDDRLRRWTKR